jgi:cell division protease FtsH
MTDKARRLREAASSLLPVQPQHLHLFAVASAGYFLLAIGWLLFSGVPLSGALPFTLVTYVILTAVLRIALLLAESEEAQKAREKSSLNEKQLVDDSQLTARQPQEKDQEVLRRRARIDALRREARSMHDKIFDLGAKLSIGFVLCWFGFWIIFQSSPEDVFLVPWYILAAIWFFQIVLLPRWLVYTSFLTAVGLRFSFEVFGPTVILLLPNFLMLPLFYFLMMIFMFGSIMLPNIMQIKFHKPGDATWETPEGTMRGQPEARAITEVELRKFISHAEGKSDRPASRGIIFEGPPGTGKTLYAKEIGTRLNLPYVFSDAQALNAPFFGFSQFIVLYLRARVEALAKEYGGAIIFIDEAENLFQMRSGMPGIAGIGKTITVWDMFHYDKAGSTSSCGIVYDSELARERFWELKQAQKERYEHPVMFLPGAGLGGSAAIFSFLTWLDGVDSPPLMTKLIRGKVNDLLNAFFIPVTFGGKILRLPPAKPPKYNLLFIAATNRAWMLDPAIRRPGRFGVTARFKTPDVRARADVIDLYLKKAVQKKWAHPDLLSKEKIEELARATPGMSPAEIEQMINLAPDIRSSHVENLKRIKELIDSGRTEDLLEEDQKFWLRNKSELENPGWDDLRADWKALMEARNQVLYGRADPGRISSENKRRTAYHEFMGHLLPLKAFLGNQMRPTVLSVMPRGQALGMVAHVPVEERDPKPQSFYEGLLRVSVGSTVAERFFFNENEPGVSSDLENATRIACFMVGKAAMVPYHSSGAFHKKYAQIGETLISVSDEPDFSSGVKNFVERVLAHPDTRERVAVLLGQAAVDVYRLIKANEHLAKDVVRQLQELDELSGKQLEDLWDRLDGELIKLSALDEHTKSLWPEKMFFGQSNPFYTEISQGKEAKEVV